MRKTTRILICVIIMVILCTMLLSGCDTKAKNEEVSDNPTVDEVVEVKKYLSLQTSIAYSSGDTKNWTYGNQRKEFPNNDSCYVRIGSTAIATGFFGKGDGDEIEVIYRFTGTKNCTVEISDGKATIVDSGDENITIFTRKITAAKEKKATEDILIFRYTPNDAESVSLEVIYDDQVAEKYDEFNTVYFVSDDQ
jgi:hypothetical protein